MKTKHTKGAWEQKSIFHASTRELIASGKRIALILQYDDNGGMVADYEECEANAKLIAAAPEMIEILDLVVGSMSLERIERFDLLDKVKAIIKKATE
jgi:hypothetical protein